MKRIWLAFLLTSMVFFTCNVDASAASTVTWDHIVDVIAGEGFTAGLRSDGRVVFTGEDRYGIGWETAEQWSDIEKLEWPWEWVFGYKKDGSVVTTGDFDLSSWTDVVSIVCDSSFVAGLRADGTVSIAFREDAEINREYLEVTNWRNIKQLVLTINGVLVGLQNDGTVVATDDSVIDWWGNDPVVELVDTSLGLSGIKADGTAYGFDDDEFYNIESISANYIDHLMYGLRHDGTVALGESLEFYGRGNGVNWDHEIRSWNNIKKLYFREEIPLGLRNDGTVAAVSNYTKDKYGDWDFSSWRDVTDIYLDNYSVIGLKSNGTLYVTGGYLGTKDYLDEVAEWTDIAKIHMSTGYNQNGEGSHIIGIKKDGTLIAAGDNTVGQCDVMPATGGNGVLPRMQVSLEQFNDVVSFFHLDAGVCALQKDGTVTTINMGECTEQIEQWTDIEKLIKLSYGGIAGIRKNGTVVIAANKEIIDYYGENCYGFEDYKNWTNIIDVTDFGLKIFGLRSDGTIVATGGERFIQGWDETLDFKFSDWRNITKIKAISNMNGDLVLLGLSKDGTLRSSSWTLFIPETWDGMQNVADLSCSQYIYLIIKKDGSISIGGLDAGLVSDDVKSWKNIIQICAEGSSVVGLKHDGTVVTAGFTENPDLSEWQNINKVYLDHHGDIFGLCEKGKVRCHVPDKSSYDDYNINIEAVESWTGIEKITWIDDDSAKETIVIGFLNDGRIVSTRELDF